MHLFPAAEEMTFLIGCELRTITLMRWQTHLEFDRASLSVEWAFEHVEPNGATWRYSNETDGLEPLALRRLCQQTVQMIMAEPHTLTLAFGGGDLLRVFTEERQYECGQISDANGTLIVF